MPNLFLFFLQNIVSPLLLIGFFIVVLFAVAGLDGVPIAKAILVLMINTIVGIVAWFFRIMLTVLALLFPGLQPLLNPGCVKAKGKNK